SSRRRHTRFWSSDVCSSDLEDGQVTIAFDSRSVARQARAYLDLADSRVQSARQEGMPIAFRRVAEHRARAWDLLAEAEALQTAEIGRASCRERGERGRWPGV